jgi:hypothetical protein
MIAKIKRGKNMKNSEILPKLVVIKQINWIYDSYLKMMLEKKQNVWFPLFIHNFFEEKYRKLEKVAVAKIKLFLSSVFYYSKVKPVQRIVNCGRFIGLINPFDTNDFKFYL